LLTRSGEAVGGGACPSATFRASSAAQAAEKEPPRPERADYVRELQRIALGQDPTASTRDRLAALKELLKLESGADGQAVGAVYNVYADGTVVKDESGVS